MCHVTDCEREQYCRGYCRSHYYRLNRYGDPEVGASYKAPRPECEEYGCGAEARVKGPQEGYCKDHGTYCAACGKADRVWLCEGCAPLTKQTPERLRIVANFMERTQYRG